ncbi:MAG: YHS domain-containing protein [Candidatus Marsarchaeota archaeon]|nr:YHS domain-containing protein [Candidatus Marsarchaeota archaeon]
MPVHQGRASAKAIFSSKTGDEYRFCSLGCKEKFDKAPEEYAK